MSFVDFSNLSTRHQSEAIALRPKWALEEFLRFQFWVTKDGNISARSGHHRLTEAEGKRIDAMLKGDDLNRPDKGDLGHFRTATFTVSKP